MYKNELVEKYAQNPEDQLVLARVLDKMDETARKKTLTCTHFLNENQAALAELLVKAQGNAPHCFFGGYEGALRTVVMFFPDYIEPAAPTDEAANPLAVLRCSFSKVNTPSHRDFLGALMGLGVKRETVGDILVREGSCDIIVLKEILPFLTSNFEAAGRTRLTNTVIAMDQIQVPEAEFKLLKDTIASSRLDNAVSAGFSTSREKASEAIKAGKVFLNHMVCTKADKPVNEGDMISVRGMGKFELQQVGALTKKGRLPIVIKKYV
ncbi:MAG: RNA-binding protein [Thermoclostridium sp.]|nr:RNA-binding protein [Thermoclostridium sp.]